MSRREPMELYRSVVYWLLDGETNSPEDVFELTGVRTLPELYRQMLYVKYLKTQHWKTMRRLALELSGGECALCDSRQRLQVHHRTYARLGEERLADLIVLCAECHGKHHGKFRPIPRRMVAV